MLSRVSQLLSDEFAFFRFLGNKVCLLLHHIAHKPYSLTFPATAPAPPLPLQTSWTEIFDRSSKVFFLTEIARAFWLRGEVAMKPEGYHQLPRMKRVISALVSVVEHASETLSIRGGTVHCWTSSVKRQCPAEAHYV
jgi:hypothetical protein